MNLSTKIILSFLLLSILPITIVSVWGYTTTKSFFENEFLHDLEVFADVTEKQINKAIEPDYERFIVLSHHPKLLEVLQSNQENKSEALSESFENILHATDEFELIVLTDTNGTIIGTFGSIADQEVQIQIHPNKKNEQNFELIRTNSGMYYLKISGSIFHGDTYLGNMYTLSQAADITSILSNHAELEKTGEILLVRQTSEEDIEFLTPFKHETDHSNIIKIDSNLERLPAKIVLEKRDEVLSQAFDYRDEPVFAVTRYLYLPNWGLIVKIDRAEALQVANSFLSRGIFINFSVLIIVFITSFYLTRSSIKPIQQLVSAAQRLASGEYSTRVPVTSTDELKILQKSFNILAESIQNQIIMTQEEKARLQSAIQALPLGFVLLDINQNIELSNNSLKTVLNTNTKPTRLTEIDKYLKSDVSLSKLVFKTFEDNKKFNSQNFSTETGKILNVFVVPVVTTQQAHTIGTVLLFEDVTDEINLSKSKDEFLAVASHELKTPLTSIKGNASLIKQYFSEKFKDKEISDMLTDIENSTQRLMNLVNDFLNVSRLEQGKLQYTVTNFDLISVVNKVIFELKNSAKEKNTTIRLHSDLDIAEILADEEKTEQILINIVGNAIKFTENGKINIQVYSTDTQVICEISDTGQGIKKANQHKLFNKFSQTGENTLTRDATQGSGLGLYISKKLIEAMNGSIQLKSSVVGEGTTFELKFPKA